MITDMFIWCRSGSYQPQQQQAKQSRGPTPKPPPKKKFLKERGRKTKRESEESL